MVKPLIISDKNKIIKIKSFLLSKIKTISKLKPQFTIVIGGDGFMPNFKKNKNSSELFYELILEIMVF